MENPTDTARAILGALTDAQVAGRSPVAIVLDAATRDGIEAVGLGYWAAGPATWSLFKVPVVIEHVPSWHLQFALEAETEIA
jgi:hypothetical protein